MFFSDCCGKVLAATLLFASGAALADQPHGFLETVRRHTTLTSTVTENGDLNPYAVIVAPVSAGRIAQGDVLVDNFNNISNLQGTGTSIVGYRPSTGATYTLVRLPQSVPGCPGGVGLTTAMTMLRSGWIIVGSTPSRDGTTATKGDGCLIVLDPTGKFVTAWAGPLINDPWGDMAVIDHGDTATLFVSMAGFGLPGPDVIDRATGMPVVMHKSTVLRMSLSIPAGKPPVITDETVVGSGFSARADRDNFLLGPTGLALGANDTLYVTDGLDNLIVALPNATTRKDSAGTGTVVTQGGLLSWPLAMVMTPEGHLLVCNGKDGRLVEVDPAARQQVYAQWINNDQAQSPPGNGDLFGIALTPDAKGFYYVMDDVNSLMLGGKEMTGCPFSPTRRGVLGAAMALAGTRLAAAEPAHPPLIKTVELPGDRLLPFYGAHQNGILTPQQGHTYFAAFDIISDKRDEVSALLQRWTQAAAALTQARPLGPAAAPDAAPADSGDVLGLPPSRLTLTFGFGPGVFTKDRVDRFGLAKHRPAAFVDLPRFVGDQLDPARTGGDLSVQACGDDQQAVMSAVRQLMRLAYGVATIRWVQAGFLPGYDPKVTPRNLMGFKDGTFNVAVDDPAAADKYIWVGDEGGWMRGGSYVVARPIRIALEHWDRMKLSFQEQTVGRTKIEGAPIGRAHEFDALDLDAVDADGNPLIAENAHVRLAAPQSNDGAQILRRGYSYDNGVSMVAERWPPWRHALELDAGLLFVCYQRDPRTGFIKIFDRMSKFDMMNQFVTHVGGGMFACPGGIAQGRYVGQDLFEA